MGRTEMSVEAVLAELAVDHFFGRLALVDERIHDVLGIGPALLETGARRVADSGGKRLRPALTIACARVGERFDDTVISGAAATELVQVGSLVHDDIFEEAASRRGIPTINAVEGPKVALLAGDFILARAGEQAARSGQRQAEVLADALVSLCEGQVVEMEDLHNVDRSIDRYFTSIAGKTAVLFEAACRIGGLCAHLPDRVVDGLATFGREFGLAFQVLDDVLDLVGSAERLRKPVGIDIPTGVYTYPVLCALEADTNGTLRRLLERREPDDLIAATQLVRGSSGIQRSVDEIHRHIQRAHVAIDSVIDRPARGLINFTSTYAQWALDYFAIDVAESTA
jgi:heptaprenyl diphosphate synthase